jgi:hypothetical protein
MGLVAVLAFASVPAGGCALNAALEVEMQLPADGLPRARVQPQDPTYPFEVGWGGGAHVFDLSEDVCEPGRECNVRFSVVSNQTDLDRLFIRVLFCDEPGCDADDPSFPSLWYTIEDPFQKGGRTFWNPSAEPFVRVPDVQPSAPATAAIEVPKCEIRDECWPADQLPDAVFGFCNSDMQRFCDGG